jgi:hypothetical protein
VYRIPSEMQRTRKYLTFSPILQRTSGERFFAFIIRILDLETIIQGTILTLFTGSAISGSAIVEKP